MLINIALFVLGFAFLVKGADFLVRGSSSLAKKLGVSDFFIGLTIVALGTSAPELVVSLIAALRGKSELLLGNLVGSNVANTFLILGVAALMSPLTVKERTVKREMPLLLLLTVLAILLLKDFSLRPVATSLSQVDGIVLILSFLGFLAYVFNLHRRRREKLWRAEEKRYRLGQSIIMTAFGLAGLILGAHWIVGGVSFLAAAFGLKESFIGLTIVALGTSLPELAASLLAVYRHKQDMAVANVIGSNIFNFSLILGLPALFRPISFNPTLNRGLFFLLAAILLLFAFMFASQEQEPLATKRKILKRWQGALFLFLYLIYLFYFT